MTRRTFTGAVASGLAAAQASRVVVVMLPPGAAIPDSVAAGGAMFTRAWTACPDTARARAALLTGRYPHAHTPPATVLDAVFASATDHWPASSPVVFVSGSRDDSPSEASTHVSLAIQHPRLARGKSFDFPVSTVDVAPTLLSLTGVEAADDFHGRDLSELLAGGKGERPESIYAEGKMGTPQEWRMMVRGFDKIVVRKNLDLLHLYNLDDDPEEEHDLAREIGYRLKIDELRAQVRQWMKRTGDGMDPSGLKRR